ncbi:MAG: GNAT family N-acetyltransferase [Paracoccaceae bacterium]
MTLPRCTHAPQGAAARAAQAICDRIPILETERLILRAPQTRDFPTWAAIHAGDESGFIGGPTPADRAFSEFSVYIAGWLLHGHGLWAVERREDGQLLGFVHIGLEWEDYEPELGWMFSPEARGQGYATEAARAARDHALGLLGSGNVVSYVNAANAPSWRLAARLGAARDRATEAANDGDSQVWRHGGTA